MTDTTDAATPVPAPAPAMSQAIIARVTQALHASLLPVDRPMAGDELAAAARFVAGAAATRAPGQSCIAVETVTGSAGARFMRIAVINDDMPFLVDSIAATLGEHGLTIDRLLHPVVPVRRDAAHHLVDMPEDAAARESLVYIETRRADARARAALSAALALALGDVRAAVADWPAMQAAMALDADRLAALDRPEGAALLRWLGGGMLTQLGHVIHRRDGSDAEAGRNGALGICRMSSPALLSAPSFARAFAWFDEFIAAGAGNPNAGRLPLIVKSNLIAQVHRRVPLDLFITPVIENGRVAALSVHAGVWTSAALAAPPTTVPRMRAQLAALMQRFGFTAAGHAGKALVHALTRLPHDLLIGFTDADLERVATAMMSLIDRPRSRLALVEAQLDRHLFAFVWLPRDALTTDTRLAIADMLSKASGAQLLDWSLEVEGSALAQLLFVFDMREIGTRPRSAPMDEAALDLALQDLLRGWGDAVEAELAHGDERVRAAAIAARYAPAFPLAYRGRYGAAEAAIDIACLRRLGAGTDGAGAPAREARLYRLAGDPAGQLRLKLYQRGAPLGLSDTVPALENFGFRVIDNIPTILSGGKDELGSIHDFLLALPGGGEASSVIAHAAAIESALHAVINGGGEDDGFNRLIVSAGLDAQEANWLRAWYRYLRQAGLSYDLATAVGALMHAAPVTRGLVALFRARHQPELADAPAAAEAAEDAIRAGLADVAAINDDRLLRAFRACVMAMLRTNAFAAGGAEALAFKFDSEMVPGLPRPVPWREIFVYSARVEGIHLRAGPVARGGIRWSDRRDDFRTEVLGLMKAQRVKNAVIVPTGAKGGFYPKQLPAPAVGRDAWLNEGREAYQIFIRALLSLTDNIVAGAVVHPANVARRDGDDPYFVVAADKGTATYSDTANALAEAAGFWLGDAFASGGSKGYDHKAMAITARGAWMSVQRHFLEAGIDVQRDPVRVVGVGDMSGDVFGNGLLLSKSVRLIAAFDHRHIFLDPDPDPAASWAERARMFALPRSSWDDYDRKLLSPGGAIIPRGQKEIILSAQIREGLGIAAETADPDTLMRAILSADVGLLWFGGIGTYVKGPGENNIEVGDPANDALRIDGGAVRAMVIGEGANLGCTQAGRIAYAMRGGRINTDFIDNSAGVDCSDKEVNIKIALASAQRDGRLAEPARVTLLSAMTDAVAALVLEDNRLQALALSIAGAGGAGAIASCSRLIEQLEESGDLDRRTEGLADAETLARRASEGRGLTRPEIAVLLSSSKLVLQAALEASDVPDDPGLAGELLAAFPPEMQVDFAGDILGHRLRREIIATRIANRLVNRMGFIHPFEIAEEEGAGLAEVAGAFLAAERLMAMDAVWAAIETRAMPEAARIGLFAAAAHALRSHIADLLRAGAGNTPPTQLAAELASGVDELAAATQGLLAAEGSAQSARMVGDLGALGAPSDVARQVAALFDLDGAVGLARLARVSGTSATQLTQAFTALGGALGLDWAQSAAARANPADPWERLLVAGLARDFQQMRLDFLRRLGGDGGTPDGAPPIDRVEHWLGEHQTGAQHFRAMIARARGAMAVSPAMLAQIASQARNLLTR